MLQAQGSQQHGRAELSADYCVSNTATRVRLRLQAACFDTYAGDWRLGFPIFPAFQVPGKRKNF